MSQDKKEHVSIVICGHVDSGKSTTTGRLIYELGGINERDMQKLRDEAKAHGKDSFAFAFFLDTQKEERERGVTIACNTKEFFTNSHHYTIIDAPGHRDFIKNMITGASQADVALLMVPADGGFTVSLQKGDHKANEIQGQTRQHARLINLLGVKQLIVGINKIDTVVGNTGAYSQERYNEVKDEILDVLTKVGWKKDFVMENVPVIPISGFHGENLLKKSDKMPWWNGVDVKTVNGDTVHVDSLYDALDKFVQTPKRATDVPLRMPVSGCYSIKGVGDVITGRVEQGVVKPGDEVVFYPTNTQSNPCTGKVFSVEMHHKAYPQAGPGDNVGLNIKGLPKERHAKPKTGDVMVLKSDSSLRTVKRCVIQAQVLDHPGELKEGYTPVAYVRTSHSAVKIVKINWRMGKETANKKMESPPFIKANDMCELVLEPQLPLVCLPFNECEGLGRVAIMEGHSVVMLGRVISVEF